MTKRLLSKKATNKGEDKPVPARVHSADLHLYRQVFGELPCDEPSSQPPDQLSDPPQRVQGTSSSTPLEVRHQRERC